MCICSYLIGYYVLEPFILRIQLFNDKEHMKLYYYTTLYYTLRSCKVVKLMVRSFLFNVAFKVDHRF